MGFFLVGALLLTSVDVDATRPPPVRLEFPILSLNPGLRPRCVGRSAHVIEASETLKPRAVPDRELPVWQD